MIVMTADQRGSTNGPDLVPEVLEFLAGIAGNVHGIVVRFERTVGDEVQGVLDGGPDGAALAVDLTLRLLRDQRWSVGLGVGAVELPLPTASREGRGTAFYRARDAVERAKTRGRGISVAVEGPPAASDTAVSRRTKPDLAAEVEALLRLLAAIRARRTPQGWEVADMFVSLADKPGRQRIVAQALKVSEQAVSQRVRASLWQEEMAVWPVVVRLLADIADEAES